LENLLFQKENFTGGEEQESKAIEAAQELSGLCGRKGMLPMIVEKYWWPEICAYIDYW
jgi:hypothetical protein